MTVVLTRITCILIAVYAITVDAESNPNSGGQFLMVLGVAQDAGYPQAGCYKPHCLPGWEDSKQQKPATSLGLVDEIAGKKYLFEATPNLPDQLRQLDLLSHKPESPLSGIFLTHAHIGHYTGLMYFGHEAMGSKGVPVFTMPRMKQFLEGNGPWSQLVQYGNVKLGELTADTRVVLDSIEVTPFLVPHRDEFSETVGYRIEGSNKTAVFIPDINKWSVWGKDLQALVKSVDYAFLDATFYDHEELPGRDMSKVPHPLVTDTMKKLKGLKKVDRSKVWFIHMNHTNPMLDPESEQSKDVHEKGFNIARRGLKFVL